MEDSLEDYIRISRNTISQEPTENRKGYQVTVQRKKECDDRAMKIVEFSIDGKLRPEILTRCLPHINQSHYQDIVEERAITKLCGYPVCGKRIPDMPKKQYYISTKSNKVYDITERKNFCSNYCYKASLHIKKQIDDSPLWLRKLDSIPEYQLLESSEDGLPGEYVDQGIVRTNIEPTFTPVATFTAVSLEKMAENEKGRDRKPKREKVRGLHKKVTGSIKTLQTISEKSEQLEEAETEEQNRQTQQTPLQSDDRSLPVIIENEESSESKSEPLINQKNSSDIAKQHPKKVKKISSKSTARLDIELKTTIKQWLTLDTYIHLYGEHKIKQILKEKKLSDHFERLNIASLRSEQQLRYVEICKRLHLQEMADEKLDKVFVGGVELKPLPDYKKLKEENKNIDLKVKCFYGGVMHETENSNFPSCKNVRDEQGEEPPAVLPLVDVNSQTAMRRKIFLVAVNKAMQQLLQVLRVNSFTAILSDLQALVKTFRLRADNIMFKPVAWNYIAIILLNMLSVKDPSIKNIIDDVSSQEFFKVQLCSLPNKEGFIEDIMCDIQNIDSFLEHYISSE